MFSADQIKALSAPLNRSHVKTNPRGYDYVEGWMAIAEANRIFGFDGWNRQTLDMRQLGEPEQDAKGNWRVAYHCRVRVTVIAGDREIIREGSGYGSGIVKDLRDAHESAIKEAETDAMKRALMTFGNPFGLALYDKSQEHVADPVDESVAQYVAMAKATIAKATDGGALRDWWRSGAEFRRSIELPRDSLSELMTLLTAKLMEIEPKKDAA